MTIETREIDPDGVKVVLQSRPRTAHHEILAQSRRAAQALGYAGDVTPQQAWRLFSAGVAELVDVRTGRELQRVGRVPGAKHAEWLCDPDLRPNLHFLDELKGKVDRNDVVLLLCRSGRRSVAAAKAATQAGYRHVFNVLEGFEGDGGVRCGWLHHGLPAATE